MDDSRGVGLDVASISGILTRIDILTGKAVVEEFVIRQHMAHVASLVLNGDVFAVGSYIQTDVMDWSIIWCRLTMQNI